MFEYSHCSRYILGVGERVEQGKSLLSWSLVGNSYKLINKEDDMMIIEISFDLQKCTFIL